MTPNDDESVPVTSKFNENEASVEPPKGTTFKEHVISVHSFYGKPIVPSANMTKTTTTTTTFIKPEIMSNGSHILPTAILKRKPRSTKPKTVQKSIARQMKAPSLWRFSGKIKINRLKQKHRSHRINIKSKLGRTIAINQTLPNSNLENVPPIDSKFTSRIEQNLRLQKILKDQTKAFSISRDINWNGAAKVNDSEILQQKINLNSENDNDQDECDNVLLSPLPNVSETFEEIEVDVEEQNTNRKFFKSKNSGGSAKKYRIMGCLSATFKRGGDLKFDPLPKRKKKRPNIDGETVFLHNEISSIISRLSSPQKINLVENTAVADNKSTEDHNVEKEMTNKQPIQNQTMKSDFIHNIKSHNSAHMDGLIDTDVSIVEKYRQMVPYNTCDPVKISQQESILELLITNGICNDETFKIFITEPDMHKEKASEILDGLYCVNTMIPVEYENEDDNERTDESIEKLRVASAVIPDTLVIPMIESNSNSNADVRHNMVKTGTIIDNVMRTDVSNMHPEISSETDYSTSDKLFPIFNKSFNAKDLKVPSFNVLNKSSKDWLPIGNQYQLDVGQKEFGLRTCTQCNMQYSVHEPEDELLHQKYHNCVNILSFKGWNNERIVTHISEWGLNGRIIYVCEADNRAKKDRVKEVVQMIDQDLGFPVGVPIKPKTLVYLAIAKQQIVGVCVVQPLEYAHRLKHENGIDCCSLDLYPVKCGISRLWVSPQYRRHGIGAKLITSMRSHFIFGAFLSFDEIAFSSPTEDGKKFAAKLTQRSDFLIYEK